MTKADVPIICVLGGPGSGKGAQCEKIVSKYGLIHISTGDLIREKVQMKTASAITLSEIVKEGKLVSNQEILHLLRNAIVKRRESAKGFLIDGYPREKSQGLMFEKSVGPITTFLFFDAKEEVLLERLKNRAETSTRTDDNEDTIKKRLITYAETINPIRDYYKDRLIVINANRNIDEIFNDVQKYLDPILIKKKNLESKRDRPVVIPCPCYTEDNKKH